MSKLGVAVVGCGYWGPNLIRNFATCDSTRVVAVCDQQRSRLEKMERLCPDARLCENYGDVLENPNVHAVAIATPVASHTPLAFAAARCK